MPIVPASPRSVGRPASATRDQVLDLATTYFRDGERIDLTSLATDLGLSRATIYRWFGSREDLVTAVLIKQFDLALTRARRRSAGRDAVLRTLQKLQHLIRNDRAFDKFLQREGLVGLRILTTDGPFQRHVVAAVEGLLTEGYDEQLSPPPLPAETLAYVLVRVAEAFIYNDPAVGARADLDRLADVERVLLGLDDRSDSRR